MREFRTGRDAAIIAGATISLFVSVRHSKNVDRFNCQLLGKIMLKILYFGVLLAWCNTCFAQDTYTDSSELPDKPGIHHIKPLLEVFNSDDPDQIESFVRNNFSPKFFGGFPMEQHIGILLDLHVQHGDITFHSVRSYDEPKPETELVVVFKSARTGTWNAFDIYVTPEKPHKINGLRLTGARPPQNVSKPISLTMEEALLEFENYIKRLAKDDVFSGSVLFAQDDKILYKAAYGLASKRFDAPNNIQTKYNLGSMNKMFTSVAIMQLVSAGKLSLNDKLSKFADDSWLAKDISDKIEIRHLLTHSSGLGSYLNKSFIEESKSKYRALDDYKSLIKKETLIFEPGTDNRYSNTGMFMLGVVIESVSGQDYFSYIRDNIYKPAGMINSGSFEVDQPVPNLAIGYEFNRENETGWNNNLFTNVLKGGPAGGGYSTVEDLHRFARALTNYKLLDKDLTEAVYSNKPDLHSFSYGYGFSVEGTPEDRIVGHSGGFLGVNSNLDIYLDRGITVVVMSNHDRGASPIVTKAHELLSRIDG